MADVHPIPDGYPRLMPYLILEGASAAMEFYTEVFEASERMRMPGPEGTIGHAEMAIGDSVIMLADSDPDMDIRGPQSVGGTPVILHVYVEDVDACVERALAAGASLIQPVEDKFYGDRAGQFEDPFGHRWSVASHVEDVSPQEMARRAAEAMDG